MELAAANWSASATLLAEEVGDGLFVDMGSTTTDLIPIKGRPLAAKTDFQRLARGELVYTGLLRTALGALLPTARIGGDCVPLSPEMLAITADAYLAWARYPRIAMHATRPTAPERTERQHFADLQGRSVLIWRRLARLARWP